MTTFQSELDPTHSHRSASFESYYHPPDVKNWQGRLDAPQNNYFFQIIKMLNLSQGINIDHDGDQNNVFAFLGFCCDEGVYRNLGRRGAKTGPSKLREALAPMTVPHHHNMICYDAGDIVANDENLEAAQHALASAIEILLAYKITPIVFGGGHEMAFGVYQGIAQTFGNDRIGIINFDAHFDMRPLLPDNKGSSGTPFLQIANFCRDTNRHFDYSVIGIQASANIPSLFRTARENQVQVITADEIHLYRLDHCFDLISQKIADNKLIYVTLCLDVFAQAFAPGVSAPQSLGLTPWQVIPLLRLLAQSKKAICFDIAELAPPYDVDERTAKLAATMVYEILNTYTGSRTFAQDSVLHTSRPH